eukprot:548896_1
MLKNMSESWKRKPIDNWTCNEVQKWIINTKLGNKNQRIVVNQIKQQSMKGTSFNSIQTASDIMNLFPDINKMSANKMCAALKEIKQITSNNPSNNNHNNEQKSLSTTNETWKNKHINTWTCNELQSWIINLKLPNKFQKSTCDIINEQLITGEDFNSMQNSSDIMNSFPDINTMISIKIYNQLQIIRQQSTTLKISNENENVENASNIIQDLTAENTKLNRIIKQQKQTIQTLQTKVTEMK